MDIVGQQSWITKIEELVKTFNPEKEEERWKKMSIYQIPEFSKELKEKAFTPQVASFGPYHYGKHNLKLIEDYKQKVLLHFLKRAGKPLRDFVKAMEDTVEDLQPCYQGLQDTQWKDKYKFVRLMISDGCFMLEILRLNPDKPGDSGYTDHDPIFSVHGAHHKLPYIKRDMLMLENQIPLLVLKVLLQVEAGQTTKPLLVCIYVLVLFYNTFILFYFLDKDDNIFMIILILSYNNMEKHGVGLLKYMIFIIRI